MVVARRIISLPLFAAGGLLLLAGYGGGLAATIYYEIVSLKLMLDGQIVEGVIVGSVVLGIAVMVINLLNIPGAAFVYGASRLWEGRPRTTAASTSETAETYDEAQAHYYSGGSYSVNAYGDLAPYDISYGHTRDKPHECTRCGKRVVSRSGLDQHIAAKHGG